MPGTLVGSGCLETAGLQAYSGGIGSTRSACHAEGRGFESHQPLARIRLYRALYDVLRVPLGAVVRKDFPAGYPLGVSTESLRIWVVEQLAHAGRSAKQRGHLRYKFDHGGSSFGALL